MPQEAANTCAYKYHPIPTSDIQPDSMATMTTPLPEITRVRNDACTSEWNQFRVLVTEVVSKRLELLVFLDFDVHVFLPHFL